MTEKPEAWSSWCNCAWWCSTLRRANSSAHRPRPTSAKALTGYAIERRQKALQVQFDRSVFVSKAQFDTEFNAMRDVFRLATNVWLALGALRPQFHTRPENETPAERLDALSRRCEVLAATFNKFSLEIESLRPFYPKELHGALLECIKNASIELNQVKTDKGTFNEPWYAHGVDNRREFDANYHLAADLIRDRLDTLAVIPTFGFHIAEREE